MKHKSENIIDNDFENLTEELFSKVNIKWTKNRDDIWNDISVKIENNKNLETKTVSVKRIVYAVAAVFILVTGTVAFMWLNVKTIANPSGQHLSVSLPDNSLVKLNAQSELSYKPLWWRFSREVKFNGEGFFNVKTGSRFSVVSEKGTTSVLGTSFNVYARNGRYEVICATGKIWVSDKNSSEKVILFPDEKAVITPSGVFEKEVNVDVTKNISWINNMFYFTSASLHEVIKEIARQYNITISIEDDIQYTYTGYFNKTNSVEEVLSLVCKPFGIKFKQNSKGNYVIFQNK